MLRSIVDGRLGSRLEIIANTDRFKPLKLEYLQLSAVDGTPEGPNF